MAKTLLKYNNEDIDLFYSLDMEKDELSTDLSLNVISLDTKDLLYSKNDKQKELIDLNGEINNLEKIAILYAHGDSVNNKWHYINEDKSFSIQNWINKNDGKYKLIILTACNPGHHTISAKKSCVLATNENYNKRKLETGEVQVELFFPGRGYINNYLIDSEIEKLKNKKQK